MFSKTAEYRHQSIAAGIEAIKQLGAVLSVFTRPPITNGNSLPTSVFSEDLRFDYGSGGEQQGFNALRANMMRFLDICGGTEHLIGSILIDVDGDQALSRTYVQVRHQAVGATGGAVFDTNGEYIDRWE